MTIWPISLNAYKSLSGLGFSTYQDAGKKKKKKGFAPLVMLAGRVSLITAEWFKVLNVDVMANAASLQPQQLKQLSSAE